MRIPLQISASNGHEEQDKAEQPYFGSCKCFIPVNVDKILFLRYYFHVLRSFIRRPLWAPAYCLR